MKGREGHILTSFGTVGRLFRPTHLIRDYLIVFWADFHPYKWSGGLQPEVQGCEKSVLSERPYSFLAPTVTIFFNNFERCIHLIFDEQGTFV